MRRLLLLLAALAAAQPAAAQTGWQNGGAPPEEGSQAAEGGFGAMVLMTDDREGFFRAWDGPTPPNLPVTSRADRDRPVYAMVIFYGCAAGPDGNCNVTAEFTSLRPDGRQDGETMPGGLWEGPALEGQNLRLGTAAAALVVRPPDPAGLWRMQVRVTDRVRGVTLQIVGRVTVATPPALPGA